MPLLDSTEPQIQDEAPPQYPQERPQPIVPLTSAVRAGMEEYWPTTRLAENIQGMFGQHASVAEQPGYDPVPDIPARHLDRAGEYLHLDNPAQVAEKTHELDHHDANLGIIARSGAPGTAVAMAGGLLDPMNVAAMAIVPEAAPTRIGNAIRWSLTNAATTTGLDILQGGMGEQQDMRGSLLNIGGSAVLGGVLGSVAGRIPKAKLAQLSEAAEKDLHAPPGSPHEPVPESSAGPIQRSALEDAVHVTEGPMPEGVGEERVSPNYVPPRPEGPTVPRPGVMPEIEPHRMSLAEAIAVTKGASAQHHGISYNEALAQGLDPAALDTAKFGTRRVFTKGGASFDEMAEALHAHGYPVVDEMGNYSPNALLDSLDLELRGKKQYSDAAGDYLAAIAEHEEASERADRFKEQATPHEEDLERDAAMLAAKEAEKEEKGEEDLHALPGEPEYVNPEMESTMGAAAVRGNTLEDLETARGGKLYNDTIGRVASPGARLMRSESPKVRQLALDLLNIPGTLEGHYHDMRGSDPIERQIWREIDAKKAEGISRTKSAYGDYRDRLRGTGERPVNFRQFTELVGPAMRRGDRSGIPEVQKLAEWFRTDGGFESWFQRAKKAGMFQGGAEGAPLFAESYMTRLYDQLKIRANKVDWLNRLQGWARKQGVDPAEASMIAHDVDRRIGGSERGTMDNKALENIVPKSGRTKGRELSMPDTELEPYLVNDILRLHSHYLRTMVPEVLMTERFGTRDLSDQLQGIEDDFAHLMEQARVAKDNERLGYLEKMRDHNIETLKNARDILYGNYGMPKDPGKWYIRAGRLARQVNLSRMLGMATIKHFPDLANQIMKFGTPLTAEVMAKLMTSLDASKLAYGNAKRLGIAIDMVGNISSNSLWDSAVHSAYPEQRFMRGFNKAFSMATLETPWITGMQMLASKTMEEDVLRAAQRVSRGQVLSKNRAANFAAAGLDTAMLARIAEADKLNGRTINGLRYGMSETWADKEAARAFESAIEREAHGITMRPGVGDRPLLMNKEAGKFFLQFRSFEFAAARTVGLPMLQGLAHGDPRAVQGLLAQFAMAYAGLWAYSKATGQRIETNPWKLLVDVLDRTNLLGWTGNVIFPAMHALGFKDLYRWQDKNPVSELGPTAELGQDIWKMLPGNRGQGPLAFKRSDLHFMRKLTPYNQVFYLRRGVDDLEDYIGDQFNLPGKSLAEYRREQELKPQ